MDYGSSLPVSPCGDRANLLGPDAGPDQNCSAVNACIVFTFGGNNLDTLAHARHGNSPIVVNQLRILVFSKA